MLLTRSVSEGRAPPSRWHSLVLPCFFANAEGVDQYSPGSRVRERTLGSASARSCIQPQRGCTTNVPRGSPVCATLSGLVDRGNSRHPGCARGLATLGWAVERLRRCGKVGRRIRNVKTGDSRWCGRPHSWPRGVYLCHPWNLWFYYRAARRDSLLASLCCIRRWRIFPAGPNGHRGTSVFTPVKRELFDELVASVREAGKILRGEASPSRSFLVDPPNVRSIRTRFKLSQGEFASLLGVSIRTLQNWEQGRRLPEGPARILLQVAAKHPDAVWDVVRPSGRPRRTRARC
jgi:putative transcriptional regulator